MTRFYLMRHGETEWNRDHNRYCGRSDIDLSDRGVRQAESAALYLRSTPLDRVYASNLRRAVRTAQPTAAARHLQVEQDERVTEIDFGRWDGLRNPEIVRQDPEAWQRWCDEPERVGAGVTGETATQVFERMNRFFTEKAAALPDANVLVVSHSTAIRIYLAGVLSMPFRNYRQLVQSNAGITVLETSGEGEGMRLLHFNSKYDAFAPVVPTESKA